MDQAIGVVGHCTKCQKEDKDLPTQYDYKNINIIYQNEKRSALINKPIYKFTRYKLIY